MKKLQLKALELGASEILTREQLKNTVGGANYECRCYGNNTTWMGSYDTTQAMIDAIISHCGPGDFPMQGECVQFTS